MMIISTIQKICLFLLSYLGLYGSHLLARIIAPMIFPQNSKKFKVTYKNLRVCFPDKNEKWLKQMSRSSLKEYAKSLLESPYIYRISRKRTNSLIKKIYSEDIIENALLQKKGIIFMTPHHGSWELSGLFAASKIKTYVMYKPLRNKFLDSYVFNGRKAQGSVLVATDNSGVKALLKALKNNYAVGIHPDHTPKINQGIMSNFYNNPVNTTSLIYKLAKKNRVPIIYIVAERLNDSSGFNIHVGEVDIVFYDLDEIKAADLVNKTLEEMINKNVSQYLWSYERFRNRVGVEESIYK